MTLGDARRELEPGEAAVFREIPLNAVALRQIDAGGGAGVGECVVGAEVFAGYFAGLLDFEGALRMVVWRDVGLACKLIWE